MNKKSGDNVNRNISLFQRGNGGAMPTSPHKFRVYECSFSDIRHIFEEYHYKKGAMGGGISFCLGLYFNEEIIGGVVVGKPRHESKYKKSLDIRRMACIDEAPKNTESYFLSKVIWVIKKKYPEITNVISYSDLTEGHVGTIYKAANFKEIGETSPTKYVVWNEKRYHPRSLTIDRPYSYKLREAVKKGEAKVITGLPKKIWEYKLCG